MKKKSNLNEWQFKKPPTGNNAARVTINLKHINLDKVKNLAPKERVITIDKHFKYNFTRLLQTGLIGTYELIGTKKRPVGIETTIPLKEVERLAQSHLVKNIFIQSIKGGKKIKEIVPHRYYCVRMTVAIQIEDIQQGLQTYEERYVLIKAKSPAEAYKKIDKQKKKYEKPYLNSDGRFVRWKVESLDDCYDTDIITGEDLNHPEGAEIFSVLKNRKLTKERYWNGRSK